MLSRQAILDQLDAHVYGPAPPAASVRVLNRRVIALPQPRAHDAIIEQWRVECEDKAAFYLILARPARRIGAPVILAEVYCGLRAALPGRPRAAANPIGYYPLACRCGCFDPISRWVFGSHINAPPLEEILAHGLALAMLYGGDIAPDHPKTRPALAALGATGAISAWAWAYSRALDALHAIGGVDTKRVLVWGQSRQAKAALLAAARDERFAGAVAVQAGRGGDALTCHRHGESVAHITAKYPHWFSPRFTTYATHDPPIDQDALLALIAPRPLLIGHAQKDDWSDPEGARLAFQKAQTLLDAPIKSWRRYLRPGGHGINAQDWQESLRFAEAVVQSMA